MYLGYKFWNKTKWVNLAEADLVTGRRGVAADTESAVTKPGMWSKVANKVIG